MMNDELRAWSFVHHSSFSIHHSVKEVFAPGLVGAAQVSDDLTIDVQVVRLRAFEQPHSGGFWRPVAFAVVARAAAGHQVLPRGISPARARRDVIERQILRREDSATVLTGVVVAQKNVLA